MDNHKRIYRVYREESLRVQDRKGKHARPAQSFRSSLVLETPDPNL